MKRMLINATQQEELRVALVDGQKLYDLSIEIPSKEQKKANIYKARISRVEQSLEACFVEYGAQRHGFLPLKEISKEYFPSAPLLVYQDGCAVARSLGDYLGDDIGEVLCDDLGAFQKAQEYMQRFMPPDAQRKLKIYTDDIPLFTRYQIQNQIQSAYAHKVQLPSGGSLAVDYT